MTLPVIRPAPPVLLLLNRPTVNRTAQFLVIHIAVISLKNVIMVQIE